MLRTVITALLLLQVTAAFATIDPDRSLTKDSIISRITELTPPEKGIPEDVIGLNDERQSLAAEMLKIKAFMLNNADYSKEIATIEKAKTQTAQYLGDLSLITNCKSVTDAQADIIRRIKRPLNSMARALLFTSFPLILNDIENPWDETSSYLYEETNKLPELCTAWKAILAQKGKQETLVGYFDALKANLSEATKTITEAKNKAQTLLELVQKRREVVESKLAKRVTQDTLTDKFWVALLVIGIFSVGTILAVKLFTTEIQLEWVASGQVIQFVTVMILLSVVMALGLAGILKENTLGTLLGGIAGYVLAQGVGRAAAREVSRGQSASRSDA